MKVLIDHPSPFFLAHGGVQTQIEQTRAGLEAAGVEVEYLRWWDDQQRGDIIHFFGAPSALYQLCAREKKLPLVNTLLLTQTCNYSTPRLVAQALMTRFILAVPFGNSVKHQLSWDSYRRSECIIVGLEAEKRVLEMVYGIAPERIKLLPLGCEQLFVEAPPSSRTGDHLVCVGTITERKGQVELAQFAMAARVPILFVGKPYSESDAYWLRLKQLAAHSEFVRHQPHVQDRQALLQTLRNARGFVLLTKYENWCIAADEAAGCGLPLLLPDQNWARERFAATARFFTGATPSENARILRQFFDECPQLPRPPKPLSWLAVGRQLADIYRSQLAK